LHTFQCSLQDFSRLHKETIKKDPIIRRQFQQLCQLLGVDPLASSKGFWADLLGTGDFYYVLAIQIVEICMQTRETNGGWLELEQLQHHLQLARQKHVQVTRESQEDGVVSLDDIKRAIQTLEPLGGGYQIVNLGSKLLVQSVPEELDADQAVALLLAQTTGYFTAEQLQEKHRWPEQRVHKVVETLLCSGICWLDIKPESGQRLYWIPSFALSQRNQL